MMQNSSILVRTGKLVERAIKFNGTNLTGLISKNVLLPIPQSDINLNIGATLEQNPGY